MCNSLAMPDDTDDADLIGGTDALQILEIDKSTLSRWVAAGKLTPITRLSGPRGAFVFARADVEALAKHRAA